MLLSASATGIHAPIDLPAIERAMDSPSGASMYVTRRCIEQIGLMDESYFLFYEDLDWGVRAKKHGLGYASDSIVAHQRGTTTGSAGRSTALSRLSVYCSTVMQSISFAGTIREVCSFGLPYGRHLMQPRFLSDRARRTARPRSKEWSREFAVRPACQIGTEIRIEAFDGQSAIVGPGAGRIEHDFLVYRVCGAPAGAQSTSSAGERNAIGRAATVGTSATAEWPDAKNTGVPTGTSLIASGPIVVNTPGATISAMNVSGNITVNANNVTIQNSKITVSTNVGVIQIPAGVTKIVVRNCEINGVGSANDGSDGINGQGTFIGNNIYNVENGLNIIGSSTIKDNYIHDLLASGSPHYDGIQIDGNVSNTTISHNTIINSYDQTSAVMIDNYFGPISDISVDNNVLIGGGYTVYSDGRFNGGPIEGVSFTNNRMGKGQWGYRVFEKNLPLWRGNTDRLTGRDLGSK